MAPKAKKTSTGFNWGKFGIVVCFVGLFVCGLAVGWGLNSEKIKTKRVGMSEGQCIQLANQIINTGTSYNTTTEQIHKLKELNDIYSKNCAGRVIEVVPQKPEPKSQPLPAHTCAAIEEVLKKQLSWYQEDSVKSGDHLERAQIYANLANRGCEENRAEYRELALREIELARAITDDKFYNDNEIVEMIDTYKKLNMKAEAEKVFDMMKKVTDPAIDFILQVEKIINE